MKNFIDPICGMQVTDESPYHFKDGDKTIHFCSKHCLETYMNESNTKLQTYFPLLLILGYLILITVLLEINSSSASFMNWTHNFMGGFFLVFSFFKLLDLKGFASSFRGYDVVARKFVPYAYSYPFIELFLGLGFILKWNLYFLNWLTLVFMFISSLGVIESLIKKNKIQCACLGTVFNLPMSTVTLVEDLMMVAMAIFSLLSY